MLSRKAKLQEEADRLSEIAEKAQQSALKAEEDVANVCCWRSRRWCSSSRPLKQVNDAETVLYRVEKVALSGDSVDQSSQELVMDEEVDDVSIGDGDATASTRDLLVSNFVSNGDVTWRVDDEPRSFEDKPGQENGKLTLDSSTEVEVEVEKLKSAPQVKKPEMQKKEAIKDSPLNVPKQLLKKLSRFFHASFFSSEVDGEEFTLTSVFNGLIASAKKQASKLIAGVVLHWMG